jgi:hypothetical protein
VSIGRDKNDIVFCARSSSFREHTEFMIQRNLRVALRCKPRDFSAIQTTPHIQDTAAVRPEYLLDGVRLTFACEAKSVMV